MNENNVSMHSTYSPSGEIEPGHQSLSDQNRPAESRKRCSRGLGISGRWVGWIVRGEVHDYKDRLPRHASLRRIPQAFAAAPEEVSRVFLHAARIKKDLKSAIANHGNRFRKIDLR